MEGLHTTPFALLYGRAPTNKFCNEPLMVPSADTFIEEQLQLRQEARDFFHMAQTRMAFYYDKHRQPLELSGKVYKVYIWLARKVDDSKYTLLCACLDQLSALSSV